jgi:hypothetical protein
MFKVPESLTSVDILGVEIPVHIDQARCIHAGALGMFDGNIILRAEYSDHEEFIKTLVHESFHASCYTVGLQLDIQIEEVLAVTSERLFISMSQKLSEVFMGMEESESEEEAKKPRGRPKGSKNRPK